MSQQKSTTQKAKMRGQVKTARQLVRRLIIDLRRDLQLMLPGFEIEGGKQ